MICAPNAHLNTVSLYDNAGNMISANSGGTITTYTYDYNNRLTEVTQGGTIIATYTYSSIAATKGFTGLERRLAA